VTFAGPQVNSLLETPGEMPLPEIYRGFDGIHSSMRIWSERTILVYIIQ